MDRLFTQRDIRVTAESKLPQMTLKQTYNYLVSKRQLNDKEKHMLEALHEQLGKDKWD